MPRTGDINLLQYILFILILVSWHLDGERKENQVVIRKLEEYYETLVASHSLEISPVGDPQYRT